MTRFQRHALIYLSCLIFPVSLWAAPFEMLTVSTAPIGPTPTLCQGPSAQYPAFIAVVGQGIIATIHSPTAVPSSTLGFSMGPGQTIVVDHATDFRAVRSGVTDATAYVVCIPQ